MILTTTLTNNIKKQEQGKVLPLSKSGGKGVKWCVGENKKSIVFLG